MNRLKFSGTITRQMHIMAAGIILFCMPTLASAQSGSELKLPGQPADRVAKLPVGTVALDEDDKCNKKQFKWVKKLAKKRQSKVKLTCYGSVQFNGAGYLFVNNWLISKDRPGPYQLVKVVEKTAVALGDVSAVNSGWVQATSNGDTLELLSISVSGTYDQVSGWPYLRYQVVGDTLTLIPTRMFTTATNPININRLAYEKALADAEARMAAAAAKKKAEQERLNARRQVKLAASRGFTTSYARAGISLGHNFAMKGRTGCFTLPGLKEKLDKVVNEMEVYNNSSWMSRKGCRYVPFEEPETYQKVGWYNNGKFFISIVFIYTESGQGYWKPVEVIPNRLAGRSQCFSSFVQRTERGVTIRVYGRDNSGLIAGCINDYPFLGREVG